MHTPVGTDLARLLGSLIGSDRIAWDEGIAAYQQFRPLSFAERGLLEVFDRSGILLSGVTWLEWVCREQRQFPQRERVEERLELIVQRLEQLAQSC
jgi:Ser/Thr protein kinase RdoA (MazF antagonist)